jgi:putative membrane protein
MLTSAGFAFLHFAAVFVLVGALFYQWATLSRAPTWAEARRIQLCDNAYGLSAGVLLVVGLLRVYLFEKGAEYYFSNAFFLLKLALFILGGLLSIYPTLRFLAWRRQTRQGLPPLLSEREFSAITIILRLELGIVLLIALCASLMARGISL